jgi:dTDP-4-dehydrorhamnose 3,5-epimerase
MHFQYPPKAEIKIVKCVIGKIFDVAIDIRNNSPTFLKWHGEILSAENRKLMYVPEGFAHGFQTLEDNSEIIYLNSNFYSPEYEGCVRYNDPMVRIKWPFEVTDVSVRDQTCKLLTESFKGIIL